MLFLFLAFICVPLFVFSFTCCEFFFIPSTLILYLLSLTLSVGFSSLPFPAYLLSQFPANHFFACLLFFPCFLASVFAFFHTLSICLSSFSFTSIFLFLLLFFDLVFTFLYLVFQFPCLEDPAFQLMGDFPSVQILLSLSQNSCTPLHLPTGIGVL